MRMRVKHVSVRGRGTQGVRVITLESGDKLVSVAKLAEKEEAGAEDRGPGLAVVPPPPEPEEEDAEEDAEEDGEAEDDPGGETTDD